jgi:hypothetical protein
MLTLFTICVDAHRHALIMAQRGWSVASSDLSLLIFGMQDAGLMGENMVIAIAAIVCGDRAAFGLRRLGAATSPLAGDQRLPHPVRRRYLVC